MNILTKVTIYDWMRDLNLRGSDLYVYAAFREAGGDGIAICAESDAAAELLGMHISTFTRTRDRLLVAGLITYRELPGRGRTYFVATRGDAAMPKPQKPVQRPLSEPRNPVADFVAPILTEDKRGGKDKERHTAYSDGEIAEADGEIERTVDAILSGICDFVKILGTEAAESGRVREGLAGTLEKTHDTFSGLDGKVCCLLEDVRRGLNRRKN